MSPAQLLNKPDDLLHVPFALTHLAFHSIDHSFLLFKCQVQESFDQIAVEDIACGN